MRSISFVINPILRDTYIHDCSVRMGMNEATLINTLNGFIRSNRQQGTTEEARAVQQHVAQPQPVQPQVTPMQQASKVERMLAELVIRHGDTVIYNNVEAEDGGTVSLNIAQYIDYNLGVDGLKFANPVFAKILAEAVAHSQDEGFNAEQFFIHHEDIDITRMATELCVDQYRVIDEQRKAADDEQKNAEELRVEEENRIDALRQQTEHLLNDFRMDWLEQHLKDLQAQIAQAVGDPDRLKQLMEEYKTAHGLRSKLARLLGNNIIA